MTGKFIFIIFMVIIVIFLVVFIWILTPEEDVKESYKKNLSEDEKYKESGWCSNYDDEDK